MDDENNVLFVRGCVQNTSTTCKSEDDVWDDSALIKAYDKAVNLAKDEVVRRMEMDIESTEEKSTKSQYQKKTSSMRKAEQNLFQKWTVGSPCKATYSADGEIYEAIVTKVYVNTAKCVVKFVGYGNSEKVELCSLLESDGLESQIAQQQECIATASTNDNENNFKEFDTRNRDVRSNGISAETAGKQRMDREPEQSKRPKNFVDPGVSFNSNYGIMPPAPPIPPQLMAKLPDNDADALSAMLMSWYISGFHTGYYHGIKQARHLEGRRNK